MSFPLHHPRARLLLLLVACGVAWLFASADARAAGWLPMTTAPAGAGGAVMKPRVAVDDAGNVYVAWIEGSFLEVSKRPVGGVFETPQALDANQAPTTAASNPDIGVDSGGNAVVAWTQVDSSGAHVIRQARRSAGASSFGAPVSVPTTPLTGVDNPKLAVNRAGEALLAVSGSGSGTNGTVRVFLGTSTTNFTNASAATFNDYAEGANTTVFAPDVAINEAGDAAITWRANASSTLRLDAGYRVHGANLGPREGVIADVIGKHEPSVAIDSQGNAVTVWDEDTATSGQLRAYARPAGVGVPWTKLNDLDGAQSGNANPHVAFDAGNTAVAAWSAWSGGPLRDSPRPAGGQFAQPPQSLTAGNEQAFDLGLDAGAPGTIALTWAANAGQSFSVVRAAVRPTGGVFGSITTLTPSGHGGDSTDVAVDPQGNAAAVWVDTSPPDANSKIVTAEYDTTAPHFPNVTMPPTVTVGRPAAFSATVADDWSQPTIGWDFGDGGIGFGGGPTHTYTAPGTYTVIGTAFDAAGNVASFTRTVIASLAPDIPTRGVDFNASSVSGTVLVSVPKNAPAGGVLAWRPVAQAAAAITPPAGYTQFRLLGKDDNIPVGSILDATRGVSQIKMATTGTATQLGKFSQGVFKTQQSKKKPLTTALMMGGGNFRRECRRLGFVGKVSAARRRPGRRLFANVKGRFRTRGRHSTATVRGTQYLVKDSCSGTTTRVLKGSVVVHDYTLRKDKTVKAGHRYFARALRRKH